jgi:hypothetical protein
MKQFVKNTAAVLFLLLAVNVTVYKAQSSETNEIKLLVQQQIEEAKKKNDLAQAQTASVEVKPVSAPVKTEKAKPVEHELFSSDIIIKSGIMLAATIGVLIWLGIRKTKKNLKTKDNQFKKNIKLMREEKFIKEIDPKLKEIRTKLTLTSVVLNEEKQVTAAARKSQIGKEEILLASRIRTHEIQYGGQRSFA